MMHGDRTNLLDRLATPVAVAGYLAGHVVYVALLAIDYAARLAGPWRGRGRVARWWEVGNG